MKIKNSMLVVKDLEKSKAFYWEVLGLRTLSDLDIHAVLTGGLALQTEESWKGFVGKEISYQGNDVEVYFEEDDFELDDDLGEVPERGYTTLTPTSAKEEASEEPVEKNKDAETESEKAASQTQEDDSEESAPASEEI